MHPALRVALIAAPALLLLAAVLHLIPRLGAAGRRLSGAMCKAPLLDVVVGAFTIAPWLVGAIVAGWWGAAAGVAAQLLALGVWCVLHEMAHPRARSGPRIVTAINRICGRANNHVAIWATATVVPLFWFVRLAEVLVYPVLTRTVRLPKYRHSEWVSVSRQRFDGLVGHDLIWCLYCDWMTGVWSLGTEMLRNVESFWCPIRFYDGKKCENCRVDFPDIDGGWVRHDGTMAEVVGVVERFHSGSHRGWFGHPTRLTVEGREARPPGEAQTGGAPPA